MIQIFILLLLTAYIFYNNKKQNKIMSKQDEFNAGLAKLDAATNEIANDLAALRDQLGDTISQESLDVFNRNIARLEEMGKDPEPEGETEA